MDVIPTHAHARTLGHAHRHASLPPGELLNRVSGLGMKQFLLLVFQRLFMQTVGAKKERDRNKTFPSLLLNYKSFKKSTPYLLEERQLSGFLKRCKRNPKVTCIKLLHSIGFCFTFFKFLYISEDTNYHWDGLKRDLVLPLRRRSYLTLQNLCFLIYNSTSYPQGRLSGLNSLLPMKVLYPESGTHWGSDMLASFLP